MTKKGKHSHCALSAARVRTEKRPRMYGNGLYVQVDPSGARRWVQRIVINGRRRKMSLGGWPDVSLASARSSVASMRSSILSGMGRRPFKYRLSVDA